MKYKDLNELAAAFKSGELSEHYAVMLDKGGSSCRLTYYDPNATDDENDSKSDGCSELFEFPDEQEPIEQCFEALGIRSLWS